MSWRRPNERENWRTDCASDAPIGEWGGIESGRNNAVRDCDRSRPQAHGRSYRGHGQASHEDRGSSRGNNNRSYYQDRAASGNNGSQGCSQGRGGRDRRQGGRPAGLKGKDIGLFYRDQQKKKPSALPQTVSLDAGKVRQISAMLGIGTPSGSMRTESQIVVKKELENKTPCRPSASGMRNYPQSTRGIEDDVRMDTLTPREEKHKDTWKYVEQEKNVEMQSDDWWTEVMNEDGLTVADSCSGPSDAKRKGSGDEYTSVPGFQKRRMERNQEMKSPPESSLPHVTKHPSSVTTASAAPEQTAADKYSHVQESAFKRKFLQNLTGSMESNLVKSIARGNRELARDEHLDRKMKASLLARQRSSEHYQRMRQFREKLPAYQKRHEILELIEHNQVVVISGETGCGKTTQVAQFILDDYILQDKASLCHVVCTQPRRISATSVAQRVADERDEVLGAESTGYQIRLEKKLPPRKQGTIVFCTTGVMLQWMLTDAGLTAVSHLVLDEIHERDVTSDFVITLLKDVIPKRPDLKVVLMSATLNSEQFSAYYGGCPAINIPGFTFPVRVHYLEDALQCTNFEFPQPKRQDKKVWHKYVKKSNESCDSDFDSFVLPYVRHLESTNAPYSRRTLANLRNPSSEAINIEFIATLLHHICTSQGDGAVLVFLPGWSEISKLHNELTSAAHFSSSRYLIIPLHSMMPTTVQRSVFDRPRPGVRKIILATNIAETSITIDDVVFVIDCGKIKMTNFDVERNISTLKPEWVSLANAKQRRGRAGRVQDGVCYHLFSRGREATLASYPLPEMLRTTLEQVILQIKILQIGLAEPFLQRVMDPPDSRAVGLSLKMLRTLNALDSEENLTPLGYHLAKLPMDPRAGKMILMAAIFSCVDPILSVAAGLNFKDPFLLPLGKEALVLAKKLALSAGSKSDHLVLANAVAEWERLGGGRGRRFCQDNFLSAGTLQLLSTMKGQLAGYLYEMRFLTSSDPRAADANANSANVNLLRAIICAGLYPNVAHVKLKQRRGKDPLVLLRTPEDGKVSLHMRSVNEKISRFESPFLVYHTKLRSSGVFLHDSTMVLPLALLFFGEGVRLSVHDGHDTIHVNEHTYFRCGERTAKVVKVLRTKLDSILEHKISHPGTIDWNNASEGGILREIIDLFADEEFSV